MGAWLDAQRAGGSALIAVELADEAARPADVNPARQRTVVPLGHAQAGLPPEGLARADDAVEIPMVGTGGSLNVGVAVAVAGVFRLAGLA